MLLVVAGNGPALFGRDWLRYIRLDWKAIHAVHSSLDEPTSLLDEFRDLFSDKLSTITGYCTTLDLREDARPRRKFHPLRSIPFAIKATIDEELDKLEASGVIEKVPHSSWVAPIVTVPKEN